MSLVAQAHSIPLRGMVNSDGSNLLTLHTLTFLLAEAHPADVYYSNVRGWI